MLGVYRSSACSIEKQCSIEDHAEMQAMVHMCPMWESRPCHSVSVSWCVVQDNPGICMCEPIKPEDI